MELDEVRCTVAQMLERTGHGNKDFIDEVRTGAHDDGPYMQAAIAMRDRFLQLLLPPAEADIDG